MTRARFVAGDPLRALAALGVVAVHAIALSVTLTGYGDRVQADPSRYFATLFGPLGHAFNGLLTTVDLFFVLSGYLLSRPFLRAYVADEPFPRIPGYLRNRALRVLPTFWVVLLVAVVVEGTRGDSWWDVLGLASLTGDFQTAGLRIVIGQAWSLGIEAQYYLLLPATALVLVGLKRLLGGRLTRRARIVLVAVALGIGFHFSQLHALTHPTVNFASYVQFFAPGILLALLEHVVPARVDGRRWVGPVAVVTFVGGFVLTLFAYSLTFRVPAPWSHYLLPIGVGAVVAGPLLWQWSGRRAWRVLDNPPLRWIGERSYPLFLVHGLVYYNLGAHLVTGGYKTTLVVLGSVGLVGSLACSELLHRFVELPAMRLKRSYATPEPASGVVAPLLPAAATLAALGGVGAGDRGAGG